jgi:hypothetical protein
MDFEHDHLKALPQGHPARNAEGASQPGDHQTASSFHAKRAAALDPTGTAGSGASAAHKDAAIAHEKAAKSGEATDSAVARAASAKANGLEFQQCGDVGGGT